MRCRVVLKLFRERKRRRLGGGRSDWWTETRKDSCCENEDENRLLVKLGKVQGGCFGAVGCFLKERGVVGYIIVCGFKGRMLSSYCDALR